MIILISRIDANKKEKYMEDKLHELKVRLAELSDLGNANAVLSWDQQVNMPPGGAEDRGNQMGTLARITQEKATDPRLGQLMDELSDWSKNLDPDSDDARIIKVNKVDFDKAKRIPPEYMERFVQATTIAQQVWVEARQTADFAIFLTHLQKVIDLRKEYISFFPDLDHPYDALLDDFEPGMKTADVKAIFDNLRPKQVELIQAITRQPQVEDSFLHQHFEENKQLDFGKEVITRFGYDWNSGRLDKAAHPFTISFGVNDVRITTRVTPDFLNTMLFGTMHECGHALYGLGVAPQLDRTGLAGGASFAVHESQSRLWENLIGRSLPFWEYFYPRLQKFFPQLAGVSVDKFYKAINKVHPSLIRVEADEASYNLHIMLRMEVEIALIENKIRVKELPDYWNTKMVEYLGVKPPDDAKGVLQDIHWSGGSFGYFPTYALGNLISAQLWEKINQDIPDIPDQIRTGKFDALLSWLREKVHHHGRKFEPQELVNRVTGLKVDPSAYMRYLTNKFSDIYGL
jgi:carboxypeptidase Taq